MLIAECYIHSERRPSESFDELAAELEAGVVRLAKRIYERDVKVEYLLEEGSLRERARVYKTLVYLLGAVAGYHELRESVIDIYNDAKHFGSAAIEQFQKITDTHQSEIFYKRLIPPDVRHLYRIVEAADLLEAPLSASDNISYSRQMITDLAALARRNPQDGGVQQVLNLIPKKNIPKFPTRIADVLELNDRRRKYVEREAGEIAAYNPPREILPRGRRRRYTHSTML